MRLGLIAIVAAALLGGCNDDETTPPPGPAPLFPADYRQSYTEVRNCRPSGEHDLNIIRILADPTALAPYRDRDQPFPAGAVVLKEEYDFGDASCEGPIKQWTVMQRLEAESTPETLDWRWQRVNSERQVMSENEPRCYGCHTGCTPDVDGYEHTCAVP